MGDFINICAGADGMSLPESSVEALLLNVMNHCSSPSKINAAIEMYRRARPKYLMLDSSGYQLRNAEKDCKKLSSQHELPLKFGSREFNLAPKHVMESALELEPYLPDIVIGLDFPIREINKVKSIDQEFYEKLAYNVPWAVQSAAWWKELCPQVDLFLPIQCYNLDQFNIFWGQVGGLEHNGVSIPVRHLGIPEMALFFVRFYQLGIKRMHVLGTSAFINIALCAYMARHLFDWVSVDASSWRIAADNAEFFNPFDLSREMLGSGVLINHECENDCPCPFCADKSFKYIKKMDYAARIHLLRQHNWWVLERAFRDLYEHSIDIIQLESFLKTRSKNPAKVDELINILSLVEALKDVDISLLQDLFGFKPQNRKPSWSRLQASPA